MNRILLFTEYRNGMLTKGSLENVVKAKKLAFISQSKIIVVSARQMTDNDQKLVYGYGADKIIIFKFKQGNPNNLRMLTDSFCDLIEMYQPWLVLFCAADFANDMACRVGIRMGFPVMANCLDLYVDENDVKIVYPDDAGEYMITFQVNRFPAVVTLNQGIMKLPDHPLLRFAPKPDYIEVNRESSMKFQKIEEQAYKNLDIRDAEVLIACGRGIGGEKGIHLAEKLASLLHADLGTSRANVDEGLMDKEYQIGLSGKTVKPRCYIACGISGAMHHVIGMNQSEWVMAINVDRNEPIFDVADVGVIGDLTAILPRLIKELGLPAD
ncbi:electron transfer flavoprotein subunit alpha/FixB family protein [Lachnospiraceae bacterium 47-T17]